MTEEELDDFKEEQTTQNLVKKKRTRSHAPKQKLLQLEANYFDGETRARSNKYKYFKNLYILENSDNRPAIVMPDGHIFVETFSPFYSKVVDFIIAIADPCSRPKYVQEYQINPYSIFSAVSIGLKAKEIIRILAIISKTPLTDEFKEHIELCCLSVGKLKSVLRNTKYYIESNEIRRLQELLEIPFFEERHVYPEPDEKTYKHTKFLKVGKEELETIISGIGESSYHGNVARLTEGIDDLLDTPLEKQTILRFQIKTESVREIRQYAVDHNLFISDEYDFMNDKTIDNLGIQLKNTTRIRPYQEKALTKMFSCGRSISGIIVLPCGAGKTLVGIAALATINKPTVIVCNNRLTVKQWYNQILQYATMDMKKIFLFSDTEKQALPQTGPCIVISTYSMLSNPNKRSDKSQQIIDQIKSRDWGLLILDEVQDSAANTFRNVTDIAKAHTRLGLTATLIREDDKISDLRYLVGPKLYEANWLELSEQGYLARVKCFEVTVPMTASFYKYYLLSDHFRQRILCSSNPNKIRTVAGIIKFHERRGDKVLVFCDIIHILIHLAGLLHCPEIHGETPENVRSSIFHEFKNGSKVNTLILSSVGDKAIDLPSASVVVQVCSNYGARMQESQRLGRVLRPKSGNREEFNAFFYSCISDMTTDLKYSARRQQFLVDQGYVYEPVSDARERWPWPEDLLSDEKSEEEWLRKMLKVEKIQSEETEYESYSSDEYEESQSDYIDTIGKSAPHFSLLN